MKYDKNYFEKSYARVFGDKQTDWLGYRDMARFASDGHKHCGVVLEVGCGLGTLSFRLAQYWDTVIGVDISFFAVKRAGQIYGSDRVRFIVADGAHLPFGNGVFDRVVISSVFEHLTDSEAHELQREAYRVLKDDGLLVADVPGLLDKSWLDICFTLLKPKNRELLFYTRQAIKKARRENPKLDIYHLQGIGDPTHKRLYSIRYFIDELTRSGFCHFKFMRRKLFKFIFFGSQRLFESYVKFYLATSDMVRRIFLIEIGTRLKAKKRL